MAEIKINLQEVIEKSCLAQLGITWERVVEICNAERDGRCVVLDEEMIISAVEKAIMVNSDEQKHYYKLGKYCLTPCCKDAARYIINATCEAALKGAEHD